MIIGRAERWERLPGAAPSSRSDLPYQSDLTRAIRRSRSPFHPGGSRKLTRSDLSERPLQVAPEAQSDLARVTPRGCSRFYRVTTTQWSRSDLSERPTEVAPEAWSDLTRVTRRSRSRFHRSETRKRARSEVSQRPLQVAPEAWSNLSERLLEVAVRLLFARIQFTQGHFGHFIMHAFPTHKVFDEMPETTLLSF
ncbi:hypothetical protein YC2023_048284 [Brassica napus]